MPISNKNSRSGKAVNGIRVMEQLDLEKVKAVIEMALQEDIGEGDITTESVIPAGIECTAVIFAKAPGIIAGLPVAEQVFRAVDKRLLMDRKVSEGAVVAAGREVLEISGWARSILCAERVALNFLGHLSGISTLTRRFVDQVKDDNAVILDTRKTLPGLRYLKKYAVRVGGGENHRLGLFDQILIKDNHLKIQKELGPGYIHRSINRARKRFKDRIEIEVQNMEEAEESVAGGADVLLLDNMSVADIDAVTRRFSGKVILEVSGGVTLDNVAEIAQTGVDYISVGALTHSPPLLDLSLKVK